MGNPDTISRNIVSAEGRVEVRILQFESGFLRYILKSSILWLITVLLRLRLLLRHSSQFMAQDEIIEPVNEEALSMESGAIFLIDEIDKIVFTISANFFSNRSIHQGTGSNCKAYILRIPIFRNLNAIP